MSDSLIDYFFVCGLDYAVGLDSYDITSETDDCHLLHCMPPLRRPYKPSILQRFPEHGGTLSFPEDYSITSLCMPDGLRLFTSLSISSDPINHNFIIIREDASRIYGTALLFAEEIDNDDIKLAVTDLQNMYNMAHNTSNGHHSYCADCVNTVPEQSKNIDRVTESLCNLRNSLSYTSADFWSDNEKLYTLKAIGVLSQHAYIQCNQSWLYDIWRMVYNNNRQKLTKQISVESSSDVDLDPNDIELDLESKVNIESYIYNMLFEVNAPERGTSLAVDGPSMRHYCQSPDTNELPVFEWPIRGLLETLGLENLIRVFSCVMLEYRVVILSQDYRLLMLVAECITTLLFPFVWSHVYAPILPLAARHFLNAPLPFIMGIKLHRNEEEETIQLASDASVCYVNIDRQTVTSSDDIPTFPYELDLRREITEILVHTISGVETSKRVAHGRRQSLNTATVDEIDKRDAIDSTGARDHLPPKYQRRGPGVARNNNNQNVSFDDLLDIPKLGDSVKRMSVSAGYPPTGNKSSSRLSKDAGISIHELMLPTFKMDEHSLKSEMMATKYSNMLKSNKVFRELFFNHFIHIFFDYEQFIIPPKADTDMSNYFIERESAVQAFDKAGFLSEQPETHLPFLSAFLETQMFANFIDMKILSTWHQPHSNLTLFEQSLKKTQNTLKTQLKTSTHFDINFKPYFKSVKLIEATEKQFEKYLTVMTKVRPVVEAHILSCNDPGGQTCPPKQQNRFCSKHHHHHPTGNNNDRNFTMNDCTIGTDFPVLQGDCLRIKPRKKSITKSADVKVQTQDSDVHNVISLNESVRAKNRLQQFDHDKPPDGLCSQTTRALNCSGELKVKKENELVQKHAIMWKTRARIDPKPYLPNIVPAVMAKNHWAFVNTLLQECKAKTKRMVLEKMGGQEAVELGHGDQFVSGIEENTLVACLCDLLERIWCHGLNGTHGKSALWTHLTQFVERDKEQLIVKQTYKDRIRRASISDSKGEYNQSNVFGSLKKMQEESGSNEKSRSSTPDFINKALGSSGQGVSDMLFNWNQNMSGSLGRNQIGSPGGGSSKQIDLTAIFGPQRRSLVADVNAIKSMTDIKTEVGLARAFVRLALEKKLLSEHLKKLLLDFTLLRELYKRHAFLRCEEEREQFIFHLLALQAVEYYSFTNLYIKSQLIYRVYIYSGKRFTTGTSTTANAWFCVNGQHCSTGVRSIPKGLYQFEFENQNLGILTTMKIGHDNSGLSAKWYIEFVLLQNIITGQVYRFPCNHWLGKNVDDGSTERLLIGELIRMNEDELNTEQRYGSSSMLAVQTPPRSRSPSLGRRQSDGKIVCEVSIIQEQLGNSVNNLVKYFCRQQDREKITINSISGSCNITLLLCGEGGLVGSMERVFMHRFKTSYFFQRKFFIWDYLERVAAELMHDIDCQGRCMTDSGSRKCSFESNSLLSGNRAMSIQHFCKLVTRISSINQSIGKDGRFQRFVCLCVRDHMFPEWIELFGLVDCTQNFYEETSFFRDVRLREFLIKILSSLSEFNFPLEPALTDNL